jgi:hypothetical protein
LRIAGVAVNQQTFLIPGARVVVRHRHLGYVHGRLVDVDADTGYVVVEAEPIEGVEGPWEFPRRDVVEVTT